MKINVLLTIICFWAASCSSPIEREVEPKARQHSNSGNFNEVPEGPTGYWVQGGNSGGGFLADLATTAVFMNWPDPGQLSCGNKMTMQLSTNITYREKNAFLVGCEANIGPWVPQSTPNSQAHATFINALIDGFKSMEIECVGNIVVTNIGFQINDSWTCTTGPVTKRLYYTITYYCCDSETE